MAWGISFEAECHADHHAHASTLPFCPPAPLPGKACQWDSGTLRRLLHFSVGVDSLGSALSTPQPRGAPCPLIFRCSPVTPPPSPEDPPCRLAPGSPPGVQQWHLLSAGTKFSVRCPESREQVWTVSAGIFGLLETGDAGSVGLCPCGCPALHPGAGQAEPGGPTVQGGPGPLHVPPTVSLPRAATAVPLEPQTLGLPSRLLPWDFFFLK